MLQHFKLGRARTTKDYSSRSGALPNIADLNGEWVDVAILGYHRGGLEGSLFQRPRIET